MQNDLAPEFKEVLKKQVGPQHSRLSVKNQIQVAVERRRYDIECYLKCAILRLSDDISQDRIRERRDSEIRCLLSILRR